MAKRLELLVHRDGASVHLTCPAVGRFTCSFDKGRVLTPGSVVGVLETLGQATELVVPAAVTGRVANARPELVHAPVGFKTVLYELTALGDVEAGADDATATASNSALAVRAPYSGRIWLRPSPDAAPFVQPGDELTAGTTLALIEVMKTFTHLHYEAKDGLPPAGRLARVLVTDGAEIADDDALFELATGS